MFEATFVSFLQSKIKLLSLKTIEIEKYQFTMIYTCALVMANVSSWEIM